MQDYMTVIASVVNSVLVVLLPVIVVAVIGVLYAYARKVWAQIESARPELAQQLAMYARIAVEAAEQAGLAKLIDDKKTYATEIVVRWLETKGLGWVDIPLIEAEIERQVGEMNRLKDVSPIGAG